LSTIIFTTKRVNNLLFLFARIVDYETKEYDVEVEEEDVPV